MTGGYEAGEDVTGGDVTGGDERQTVYLPAQVAVAQGADGRKVAVLSLPQLAAELRQVLDGHPGEVTYRWAYHPQHRLYVLLAQWPVAPAPVTVGVAIPDGAGDRLLDFLTGTADIYLTMAPIPAGLEAGASLADLQPVMSGPAVALPGVQFRRRGER